jgi:hypothetical protein
MVSFDTTLPLHSKDEFGWNSARVSLMFLLLQLPAIFLAPFSGMLKDKFGTKFPTAAGFFAISIFIWLLGTPGKDGLPFAGVGGRGQAIFMAAIVGVGTARTLISGCGTIELTSEYSLLKIICYCRSNFTRCDEKIGGRTTGAFWPRRRTVDSLQPEQYSLDIRNAYWSYHLGLPGPEGRVLLDEFESWYVEIHGNAAHHYNC